MNKKKQNPITTNLQQIIKEANLHSEKKLKGNSFGRFTGTSTLLDIHQNTQTEITKNTPREIEPSVPKENKEIKNSKILEKTSATKSGIKTSATKNNDIKSTKIAANSKIKEKKDITKMVNSIKNKETTSNKKQRKRVWQKNVCAHPNTYVSVIDKRIDMKKLRGKSILCIGGVRSGKSEFALAWAETFEGDKAFIATMQTPKNFEAKQDITDKSNRSKKTPSVQQPKADNNLDQNSDQDNINQNPSYFNSERVKDMYRIHTRIENVSPQHSYHSHVSSKFNDDNDDNDDNYSSSDDYDNDGTADNKHEKQNQSPNIDATNPINGEDSSHIIELEERISKHQAQRGKSWITIEEPTNLIRAIHKAKEEKCSVIIVDCITLWLTNLMLQEKTDKQILNKVEELADLLKKPALPIVIVTNEVGAGVVPDNFLARRFRDLQGKANQILAKNCSNVVVSFCGLPLLLKG